MIEPLTTELAEGGVGTSAVALAGPVPQPSRRPSAATAGPTIEIPDGDPAGGALALLVACRPDAPRVLAARIDGITGELADQVEAARLRPTFSLVNFLSLVGRKVRLRAALLARTGEATGRTVEGEVLDLLRSVRRWRPGDELRAERARVVGQIRAELRRVEGDIRTLAAAFGSGAELNVGGDGEHHRTTGLVHQHDEFLRRAQALLESRESLRARLARLDGGGDEGRGAAVREAVEATGGVDALVEALGPSMTAAAAADLAAARRDVGGLDGQLGRIDPETRLASELLARKALAEARAAKLAAIVAGQQTAAAGAMVAAAMDGGLGAVQALEAAAVSVRPELAAALNRVRGDDAALLATIAEMIGS